MKMCERDIETNKKIRELASNFS